MKHKKEEVTNSTLESQKESFTDKVKLNYNWSWDFENHEKRNCFSFFKKKQQQQSLLWAKELNRCIPKEDIQMTNRSIRMLIINNWENANSNYNAWSLWNLDNNCYKNKSIQ